MKKILGILIALFIGSSVFSQGIEFQHISFQEALDKASKENKLVFMDCYTSWCGPCKYLAKNIFTKKEVGDFYNKHFVNIKMDMEKDEGPGLMKRYPKVEAFPTLLYINGDGKVVHMYVGGGEAEKLIAEGKNAMNPSKRLKAIEERYNNGERSPEFLLSYMSALSNERNFKKVSEIAENYLSGKSNQELINKNGFNFLQFINIPYNSSRHIFIKKHRDDFIKVANEKDVDYMLFGIHTSYVGRNMRNPELSFEELDKMLKDYLNEFSRGDIIARLGYKEYYLRNDMVDEYINLCDSYIKEDKLLGSKEEAGTISSAIASLAMEEKYSKIKKVGKWIETNCNRLIELTPENGGPYFYLAQIYQRQGKNKLAIENIDIYIEKMKGIGMEPKKHIKAVIDEIKALE